MSIKKPTTSNKPVKSSKLHGGFSTESVKQGSKNLSEKSNKKK